MTGPAPISAEVFLRPGELWIGRAPARVTTVLGSCVAVTMFHRRLQAGAVCHIVLPVAPEGVDTRESLRYVDHVLPLMLSQLETVGAPRHDLEVKVFGGGDVLRVLAGGRTGTVGAQNLAAVMAFLARRGIRTIAEDVRGSRGRKIVFDAATGEVLVRLVRTTPIDDAPPPTRTGARSGEQAPNPKRGNHAGTA